MLSKILFILILFGAHLFGDVIIRPDTVHRFKSKSDLVLLFHCYVWSTIIMFTFISLMNRFGLKDSNEILLLKFIMLLFGHFLIDKGKSLVDPNPLWVSIDGENIMVSKWTIIDQCFHIIQLMVVILWV